MLCTSTMPYMVYIGSANLLKRKKSNTRPPYIRTVHYSSCRNYSSIAPPVRQRYSALFGIAMSLPRRPMALDSVMAGFDAMEDSCNEAVRDVYIFHSNAQKDSGSPGRNSRSANAGAKGSSMRRSNSFSGTTGSHLRASQFSVPGGFRRQYIIEKKKESEHLANAASNSGLSVPTASHYSASTNIAVDATSAHLAYGTSSLESPLLQHSRSSSNGSAYGDTARLPSKTSSTMASGETSSFSFLATFLRAYEDSRLLPDVMAMADEDFAMLSPDVSRSSILMPRGLEVLPPLDGAQLGDSRYPSAAGDRSGNLKLAGTSRTVFTIIKSFIGTAILFIPRGMRSAGLVAGTLTLMIMAGLSTWAMVLLLKTRQHLEESGSGRAVFGYGKVAELLLGRGGKFAVDTAILLSQLGFACVYFSFWSSTLSEVLVALNGGNVPGWARSRLLLGFICLVLSTPLIWIRHLKYLAIGNFLSDVAIAFSLGYIVWTAAGVASAGHAEHDWSCTFDGGTGSGNGPSSLSDVSSVSVSPSSEHRTDALTPSACFWINPRSFLMFAGTSVYSFEGIAMVLPIQSSMKDPQNMVFVLSCCMLGISLLLASFGSFCFYVYGQGTANIIISNTPQGTPLTVSTQIAYLFVSIITIPLCLFPAIRIYERWTFKKQRRSGKKWQKNFLRTLATVGCLFVGVYGGQQLDHMVSLIGGLFSAPLALVFPPLLHLRSNVDTRPCSRFADIALLAFGVAAGVLATTVAIISWK